MSLRRVAVLLLFLLASGGGVQPIPIRAQVLQSGEQDTTGVSRNFLPAISYDSDLGLVGGGFYLRTLRRPGYDPYKDRLRLAALASTKGYLEGNVRYTWLQSFGTDIRSNIEVFAYQMLQDYYFGIGNNTSFSEQRWNNDYYFFRSVTFGFDYMGRQPLFQASIDRQRHLDLLILAGVQYEIPYVKQSNSAFNRNPPPGHHGGWLNYVGSGLLWDTRNTEVAPTRGMRLQFKAWYAPELLFSDFQMSMLRTDLRHYFTFHLIRDVTVANRLLVRYTEGEVPYWQMSSFGDDDRMRGYPRNRFLGESMITHSIELRTWLLRWPEYQVKLGGQLFMDTGRVYADKNRPHDLLDGFKQTYGFGGAMTLFDPDFLFRADIGFTGSEGFQIYVGTQYAF